MTVNKERVQLLVDALRSGEFSQTQGKLRREVIRGDLPSGYCCLGVACEVYMRNQPDPVPVNFGDAYLPFHVVEWFGFNRDNPIIRVAGQCECGDPDCVDGLSAVSANDDELWSFDEIADAFEKTFIKDTTTTEGSLIG